MLVLLPPEIIFCIQQYLPTRDKAMLASSCSDLRWIYSYLYLVRHRKLFSASLHHIRAMSTIFMCGYHVCTLNHGHNLVLKINGPRVIRYGLKWAFNQRYGSKVWINKFRTYDTLYMRGDDMTEDSAYGKLY